MKEEDYGNIYRINEDGSLRKVGKSYDIQKNSATVIFEAKDLSKYILGEILPSDKIDPYVEYMLIKMGFVFRYYENDVDFYEYRFDPRKNPEEPLEKVLECAEKNSKFVDSILGNEEK